MRLLIDECLPRALKRLLRGHTCRTVQEMAWSGIKNGALLSLAEAEFEVLITLRHQPCLKGETLVSSAIASKIARGEALE